MKPLYLLSVFALVLLIVGPAQGKDRVVLVTNQYIPYVYDSGKKGGVVADIVVAAFAEAGIEAVIWYRPWRRCAMLVEDGTVLGAFPYGITSRRKAYAWFSDEIWQCRNVFFYLKGRRGNLDFESLVDLRRFSIAGTSGNYYEDVFDQAGLHVDYAPGEASGVRKVWEMRADLFAEDELVGWSLIARLFPDSAHMFASTPTPWNINPQSLMVSKKYPGADRYLARFNEGLAAIRANGVYAAIVDSYAASMGSKGQ